jgi:Uma2 family endonuclease
MNYYAGTPGIEVNDNATVRMDDENELQPDALLRIASEGTSRVNDNDYLEGAPELIVEVAASSASYDLYEKREIYQAHGVKEYLVWQMYENRLNWFVLQEGTYIPLEPDDDGIIRSRAFPGLWLAVDSLQAGDLATVLNVVQKGLQSAGHTAFMKYLSPQG